MNLNLFENKEKNNNNFLGNFINELQNTLNNSENKTVSQNDNTLEEYNLYEKKKVFLDNKSRNGNPLAWITDEKSACVSEHGDGGSYFLTELDLPENVKVGEVYEKINGTYVFNSELTAELNKITL